MSTSEPQPGAHPNGSAAGEPAPVEPSPVEPAPVEPSAVEPVPASTPHTTRGAAARAAAAHAAERPAPTPPDAGLGTTTSTPSEPPATPTPVPAPVPASAAVPASAPRHAPAVADPTVPVVSPRTSSDPTSGAPAEVAPTEPVAPRTTGFGGHVVGALVGLFLGLLAVGVAVVGQGRILEVQVDGWDASLDVLGITLVTVGALLLGAVVWLGLWSAAVPITAGIVTTSLGALFLYAPGIARTQAMDALATANSHDTVSRAIVAGTSGTLLLAGFLVLVAGFALSIARRRGRVLGEFRERNRAS